MSPARPCGHRGGSGAPRLGCRTPLLTQNLTRSRHVLQPRSAVSPRTNRPRADALGGSMGLRRRRLHFKTPISAKARPCIAARSVRQEALSVGDEVRSRIRRFDSRQEEATRLWIEAGVPRGSSANAARVIMTLRHSHDRHVFNGLAHGTSLFAAGRAGEQPPPVRSESARARL